MNYYTEYLDRVDDAKQNETVEDFLADYVYPAPYDAETLVIWARIIFAVSRNNWRELVVVAGEMSDGFKTAATFARHFGIPCKSFQHWFYERREPPVYIIQLVGYALISELPVEDEDIEDSDE